MPTQDVEYTQSCAPISYPCNVGKKYIEPCSCRHYLECQTGGYGFLKRGCGNGTAWNHNTGFCIEENQVFIASGTPICARNTPWQRCASIPDNYDKSDLKQRCQPDGGGSSGLGGSVDGGDGGSDNIGAILGGVFGGLVVIALVVIFVVLWKKRKGGKDNDRPDLPKRRMHPEEQDEEVYDVIDDKFTKATPISNAVYDKERDVEYDNPAFTKTEPNEYFGVSKAPNKNVDFEDSVKKQDLNDSSRDSAIAMRGSHLSREDDLSRSISVGGKDVLVQDVQGYSVGYPSGLIPRQPSSHEGHDTDDGYNLGNTNFQENDYFTVERTEL